MSFVETVSPVSLAGPAFWERLVTSRFPSTAFIAGLVAVVVAVITCEAVGAVHMRLARSCLRVMLCCFGVRRMEVAGLSSGFTDSVVAPEAHIGESFQTVFAISTGHKPNPGSVYTKLRSFTFTVFTLSQPPPSGLQQKTLALQRVATIHITSTKHYQGRSI